MDPRKVIEKMNRNTGITNVILIVVGAISIIGFSAQNVFAIGPEGSMYVANGASDTVSVIDTKTNTVGSPIVVGNSPVAIALDTAHQRMYVATNLDGVSVIDAKTNTVIKTIPVDGVNAAIAFDTTHKRMYIANSHDDKVTVIDTNTNTVVGSPILVGDFPRGIAFDPIHNRMYVVNAGDENVSVIDTNTNTVVGSPISVGHEPFGIEFDDKLKRMYVTSTFPTGNDQVWVIDTNTNTVVSTITVGEGTIAITFDKIHQRMYVPNFGSNDVSVIDNNGGQVIGSPISVSENCCVDIAFDAIHGRIYVTHGFDDNITVIDTNTNTVVGLPLFVGALPGAIAFAPPLTTGNVFAPSQP
jgi:YVTN family beta-propeller protein